MASNYQEFGFKLGKESLKITKSMKILVTGARGFTGIHFVQFAISQGHEVHCLQADITDSAKLKEEVLATSPNLVAHFAGISFVASTDHESFYRVHALGTSNLLEVLSKLKIAPRVLLASSATVYGNNSNLFSKEDQPTTPIDHYATSKVAMEEMAKTFFNRLPIIIVRPFNYTGAGQKGNFLIPKMVRHFANKEAFIELGNLKIEREFNNVSMICEAYLNLLSIGNPGEIYNVCSGQARSLEYVLDTLKEITGHNIHVRINPDFVRANEVHRMVGDSNKIDTLFAHQGYALQHIDLEQTLRQMLASAYP